MRLLNVSLWLVLATVSAGCEDDVSMTTTCKVDSECLPLAGDLVDVDASPSTAPQCCNNICLMPAGGCESGYRYLTSKPTYGDCVVEPMCPGAMPVDMSVVTPPHGG